MSGTRFGKVTVNFLRGLRREGRLLLTPVPRPEKWLFVVGCYNSGTTLLAKLLGRHPHISALPTEGQFLTDQLPRDYDLGLPRMWVGREDVFRLDADASGPDVARLKKQWGLRLDRSRPVLLEKSPPNAARTLWLQRHFAPAYFVGIVRDGYAVSAGIRKKAEPHHRPDQRWPIEMAAHQWSRSNEVLLEDGEHLERIIWVKYEDLAEDPAAVIRRILEFVGLDWHPEVSSESSYSVHERRSPVANFNVESVKALSRGDILRVTEVAGPMLDHFGYPRLSSADSDD